MSQTRANGTLRKKAIPQETRRAVARRAGAPGPGEHVAHCHYCGRPGVIQWITASWVRFKDLELDHVVPELYGGDGSPENIVLACQWCNRSKGHRRTAAEMVRS